MIPAIVLLTMFLVPFVHAQTATWQVLNPGGITGTPDFSDLYFTDDNTGWISSSSTDSIILYGGW